MGTAHNVELLLRAGARTDLLNKAGRTALICAAYLQDPSDIRERPTHIECLVREHRAARHRHLMAVLRRAGRVEHARAWLKSHILGMFEEVSLRPGNSGAAAAIARNEERAASKRKR